MAEAIADIGLVGREDDVNFLEIDFDDTAAGPRPNDTTASRITQEHAASDEIDFQIDDFDVADDGADQHPSLDEGAAPSDEFTSGDLGVAPTTTAESEIGYEDDETLKATTSGLEWTATTEELDRVDNIEHAETVDEIDYHDGEADVIEEQDVVADNTHSKRDPSDEQHDATSEVFGRQVLGDTVTNANFLEDQLEDDDGSFDNHSEAGQHIFEGEGNPFRAKDEPRSSAPEASAAELSDVMVSYNGTKYELCASVHNEDPETYFFAGSDEMDLPLSEFFGMLRDVIKDEIEPSDILAISVPQLRLEFDEDSTHEFLDKNTFRNLLDLYRRLKLNDGEDAEHAQLHVQLSLKNNPQERFNMLVEAADGGCGLNQVFDNSDGSEESSDHQSGPEFAEEQADSGSRVDMGYSDGNAQQGTVEIVEAAYFYDDTDEAGDHHAQHFFDDQDNGAQSHRGDYEDGNHDDFELADDLVEDNGFGQEADPADDNGFGQEADPADDTTGDGHDDTGPEAFEDGTTGTGSHADAGSGPLFPDERADAEDAASNTGDLEHDILSDKAAPALDTFDAPESGNDPFSFSTTMSGQSPLSEQEFLDEFLERDSKNITPEMWQRFDSLPRPRKPTSEGDQGRDGDSKLNDDSTGFEQDDLNVPPVPSGGISRSIEGDVNDIFADDDMERTASSPLQPSNAKRRPVCTYRGKHTRPQATRYPRSSISPRSAALMMEPKKIVEAAFAPSSIRTPLTRSGFVLQTGTRYTQGSSANISTAEVHDETAAQTEALFETAHDTARPEDFAHDLDDDVGANEESIDLAETTKSDAVGVNEPLIGKQTQTGASNGTSATSTVDGDEITYDDETVAGGDKETAAPEADLHVDDDEIDWDHDGAEDVAVAEKTTNPSSPSATSVKRAREDDLASLDDENDSKRRKI